MAGGLGRPLHLVGAQGRGRGPCGALADLHDVHVRALDALPRGPGGCHGRAPRRPTRGRGVTAHQRLRVPLLRVQGVCAALASHVRLVSARALRLGARGRQGRGALAVAGAQQRHAPSRRRAAAAHTGALALSIALPRLLDGRRRRARACRERAGLALGCVGCLRLLGSVLLAVWDHSVRNPRVRHGHARQGTKVRQPERDVWRGRLGRRAAGRGGSRAEHVEKCAQSALHQSAGPTCEHGQGVA
mmetsp:Transcript_3082/g.11951  ORF Transcript_3082/g.11951 Transcript_3082/m.11951 type:complete len:245 (+) Transcript_3082:947-1681(+)